MLNIETFDINDTCQNYSIEFSKLIEFVKKIRTLTKIAKYHVIKILNMKISKLNKKQKVKGQEECKKVKAKEEEVEFLDKADLDSLSKRIFANKYTMTDLEKIGDRLSLEERIVIRLFSFNTINKELIEFRSQHSDWEELVDVILYKNTCGKMKVNKNTKKKSKKIISMPLSYGVSESDVKEATKEIFVTPLLEKEKIDSTRNIDKVKKVKSKSISEHNENKVVKGSLKKQTGNKNTNVENVVEEKFDISDEKIEEFIKNEDDLDEWERNIEEDNSETFDLMKPLNISEKKVEKKNKFNKPKKAVKRKSSFEQKSLPKIWKKSVD